MDEPIETSKNHQVDKLQYFNVYLAIQDQLLARAYQSCLLKEKQESYAKFEYQLSNQTDIDIELLCERIREIKYNHNLFGPASVSQLVMQCKRSDIDAKETKPMASHSVVVNSNECSELCDNGGADELDEGLHDFLEDDPTDVISASPQSTPESQPDLMS